MTAKLGVRDITRNFNILEKYDYVEIEDKKTRTIKGLFISPELLDDVKKFIDRKIQSQKQKELDDMTQFIGKGQIDKKFDNLSSKELRQKIAEEKYAK